MLVKSKHLLIFAKWGWYMNVEDCCGCQVCNGRLLLMEIGGYWLEETVPATTVRGVYGVLLWDSQGPTRVQMHISRGTGLVFEM